MTEVDHEKRVVRSKRMLPYSTRDNLEKTFFSDESVFTVEGRYNAHNDARERERKKEDIDEARIHHGKSQFPKSIMISAAVSKLGKTSLYIIEQGVRIDSEYYCSSLLSQLIPDRNALSPNEDYIFQQDGARSHTPKYTMRYVDDNLPQDAQLLLPEDWPPHSPDHLNPMDYGIWSSLATKVFRVKIRDVEHLCQRLAVAWEQITQV